MSSEAYSILNLNPSEATIDEVKRAYRQYTLLYHPDKCGGDSSLFRRVKDAYKEIMLSKTGRNSCFTHDEFRGGFKQFVTKEQQKQKAQDTKKGILQKQQEKYATKLQPQDQSQESGDDDLIGNFNLDRFNKTFEKLNGKSIRIGQTPNTDSTFVSVESKDAGDYVNKYKSFKPESSDVFCHERKSGENFAGTFNTQFEHVNRKEIEARNTTLAEYGKDPVPFIGGFTSQNASYQLDSGRPVDEKELWGGGVENHDFASIDHLESLAQNPASNELLTGDKCVKIQEEKTRKGDMGIDSQIEEKLRKINSYRK